MTPDFTDLVWDDRNVRELLALGVTPDEVEEAILGSTEDGTSFRIMGGPDIFTIFGETGAGRGLKMLATLVGHRLRVFYAKELTEEELTAYRQLN